MERRYRLRHDRASINLETFESVSLNDHRRGFAAAMAALIAEFNAYLDRDHANPAADLVGYRRHAIWLSRDELLEMISELRRAIAPRLANQATPDRARYLVSPILFPMEQPSSTADAGSPTPVAV